MKIRSDFVTNSSSSSFIAVIKDSSMTEDGLYDYLHEIFVANYNGPLKNIIEEICNAIKHAIKQGYRYNSIEELEKEFSYLDEDYVRYIEEYNNLIVSCLYSAGDFAEAFLNAIAFKYEDSKIMLEHYSY